MHTLCNKHSVNHFLEILTIFIVYKMCLLKCFYVAFFLFPELPLVTVILCKFMLHIILYHPDMETLLLARLWLHLSLAIVLGFFSANLSSPQVFFQTALMHGLQPQTCFVIVISPHLINFTTSHPRQASKVICDSRFADRYLHWKSLHM